MIVLTAEFVRSRLNYDPATGALTWKTSSGRGSRTDRVGQPAGSPHIDGYVAVQIGSKKYLAHRVIWLLVTGHWPAGEIDHRNRVRSDNRWANLRDVTKSINQQNRNNVTGTDFVVRRGLWRARITLRGRCFTLGFYPDQPTARQAYLVAKEVIHARA